MSDEQKASGSEPTDRRESKRQKSRIRACIEHVFGYVSQSMKGFYLAASKHGGDGLRYIGRRRKAAAIGLINLIYNLARSGQFVRLKLLQQRTA